MAIVLVLRCIGIDHPAGVLPGCCWVLRSSGAKSSEQFQSTDWLDLFITPASKARTQQPSLSCISVMQFRAMAEDAINLNNPTRQFGHPLTIGTQCAAAARRGKKISSDEPYGISTCAHETGEISGATSAVERDHHHHHHASGS